MLGARMLQAAAGLDTDDGGGGTGEILEDFEGGLGDDWTDQSSIDINGSYAWSGSQSCEFTSSGNPAGLWQPTELDGGVEIAEFEHYYRETSGSQGSGLYLADVSGTRILGLATNNPQWCIWVGPSGGWIEVDSGQHYGNWHRVRVYNIDWSTGDFDWEWEDMSDGRYNSGSLTMETPTNVQDIGLVTVNVDSGGWNDNSGARGDEHLFDDIKVIY